MESRPLHISINLYKVSNVYKKRNDLKKIIPGAGVQLSQPVLSFLWVWLVELKKNRKEGLLRKGLPHHVGGMGAECVKSEDKENCIMKLTRSSMNPCPQRC